MRLPRLTFWPHLLRDEAGSPAVEFAILSPLVILMLLGIFDLGMAYNTRIQIERAVNVATISAFNGTATAVQDTLQDQLALIATQVEGFSIATNAAVTEGYGCPANADNANPVEAGRDGDCDCDASSTCPYRYFVVTAQLSYDLPFGIDMNLPIIGNTSYLSQMDVSIYETILADGGWAWR
jgi:Flp pilus assembly protein TadG